MTVFWIVLGAVAYVLVAVGFVRFFGMLHNQDEEIRAMIIREVEAVKRRAKKQEKGKRKHGTN